MGSNEHHELNLKGLAKDLLNSVKSTNPIYTVVDDEGITGPLSVSADSNTGQHCHDAATSSERLDRRAIRKLVVATILCLIFMIAEIVGGVLAGSLAIVTDAAHLLTDLISFIISLIAVYIASRAPTKRMSFGFYRAEVMGALLSTVMIWVVTGLLVYLAILRVINRDFKINATIMLITSGLAILFNVIMAVTLGHSHSHGGGVGHGHSHDSPPADSSAHAHSHSSGRHTHAHGDGEATERLLPEPDIERQPEETKSAHGHNHGTNINVRAAFIHVIGDFVQSVGVFIAALIIYFKPEWKLADPICTFLFSVLVLITTFTILKDTLLVLMEGMPRGMGFDDVKQSLMTLPGVREVHNLRLWSLSVNKCALTVHLALDKTVNAQQVIVAASTLMRAKYGIYECTVQVEDFVDEMMSCDHCKDPQD